MEGPWKFRPVPTVAWHPLGYEPVGFSEIESFPCSVLTHHYPKVKNYGDMNEWREWNHGPIDVLVGGTPCQSFSVAGLRQGLNDPRGSLMLTYLAIVEHHRPRWIIWENVPGVLSSGGGRDFGTFLGALGQLGYGWSYRVLDAQWFGVPQRRRRVFVVGCIGDFRRAAEVLFERESVRRDSAPSRKTREGSAGVVAPSLTASNDPSRSPQSSEVTQQVAAVVAARMVAFGEYVDDGTASAIKARGYKDATDLVAQPIPIKDPQDLVRLSPTRKNGAGWGQPGDPAFTLRSACVPGAVVNSVGYDSFNNCVTGDVSKTLNTDSQGGTAVMQPYIGGIDYENNAHTMEEATGPLLKGSPTGGGRPLPAIATATKVRRLTPRECERLQGFPDDYTLITHRGKPAADGPRYKALGNSMAVPVMRWIGKRIQKCPARIFGGKRTGHIGAIGIISPVR
ncbi:MAG: DNA (cytosine-5-)-methyltransferase [Caulobacteraceae bacterium]|nr:DNA (cytosine-5-)-methyltransferase [Caulobacteraceae bacterium]